MAKLTDAPFLKVEATKFTETGFHGRDVDMIIHDLVVVAMQHCRTRRRKRVRSDIVGSSLCDAICWFDGLMGTD